MPPETLSTTNPAQILMQISGGYSLSRCLHVVADLPHASPREFPVRAGVTTVMHTSSSQTAINRVAALVAGLGIGLVAIVLLLAGELRSRRRRA